MNIRTIEQFVDCVLHWECHLDEGQPGQLWVYSDTPGDAGGPTNGGITIATRNAWRARNRMAPATVDDMRVPFPDEAVKIYRDAFLAGPGLDRLPEGSLLQLEVFDIGVGSGPDEGIRILQEVLQGCGYPSAVDGAISTDRTKPSQTATQAAAAWAAMGGKLVAKVIDRRLEVYKRIGLVHPQDEKFEVGWGWRATRL